MTTRHSSYEELAAQRRDSDEYREGYARARRAFVIGRGVRGPGPAAPRAATGNVCPVG